MSNGDAAPRPSGRAKWILLVLSIGFSLVMAEVILRLLPLPIVQRIRSRQQAQVGRREAHPPGLYRLDPEVGWTLAPGFSGRFIGTDFDIGVEANPDGLRNRAVGDRAPDTYRILGLGDSFAFGWGVENEDSLFKALERGLNKDSRLSYEVINAGIPGYGTHEALQLLRAVGLDYEPDLVILAFYEGNDYRNNGDSPRRRVIEDGYLREAARASTPARSVLERSVLAGLVSAKASGLVQKRRFRSDVRKTGELLQTMMSVLAAKGVAFAVLLIPDQDPEVYSRPALLRAYDRLAMGTTPLEARQELRAVCEAAHVPYIQLSARFEGASSDLRLEDTHLNSRGHEAAADELLVGLQAADLLGSVRHDSEPTLAAVATPTIQEKVADTNRR